MKFLGKFFGIASLMFLMLVSIAGASQPYFGGASTTGSIGDGTGTQGILENNYVAYDTDITGDGPLRAYGLIFSVNSVMPGNVIEVTATTNDPADFISCDGGFLSNYIVNEGNPQQGLLMGEVYQDESYSTTRTFYLSKQIDRASFNLIIRDSAGNDANVRGHLKIVVHSKIPEPGRWF